MVCFKYTSCRYHNNRNYLAFRSGTLPLLFNNGGSSAGEKSSASLLLSAINHFGEFRPIANNFYCYLISDFKLCQ